MSDAKPLTEVREALAAYAHDAWSGWMRYLFSKTATGDGGSLVIPPWAAVRWKRQAGTAYAALPYDEQESDRVEADKMLGIVSEAIRARDAEIAKLREELTEARNAATVWHGHARELAEEKLRTQALRQECDRLLAGRFQRDRDAALAERDEARAEIAKLREELRQVKELVRKLAEKVGYISDGTCCLCGGHRFWTGAKAGKCENDECISHDIDAALAAGKEDSRV